jgi:hypothetical protein
MLQNFAAMPKHERLPLPKRWLPKRLKCFTLDLAELLRGS